MTTGTQTGTPPSDPDPAKGSGPQVDLASFRNTEYRPGRGFIVRCLWYLVSLLIFESGWVPTGYPKLWILRLFGAKLGAGIVFKTHIRIKYPWRLVIGDHCWIGQGVWIDNIADVSLGDHVCISQGVYFCTGSHDYRKSTFDLTARPISIGDGSWIGARAMLLPGVVISSNVVVGAGSVVTRDASPNEIIVGNPARPIKHRPAPTPPVPRRY